MEPAVLAAVGEGASEVRQLREIREDTTIPILFLVLTVISYTMWREGSYDDNS